MKITHTCSIKLSTIKDRNVIELQPGIQLKLLDDVYSSGKINFILNKDSHLDYKFKIIKDQCITGTVLEKNIKFSLVGKGAVAKVKCICEGNNTKTYKLKTVQHHKSSDTVSELEIRGVFHDSSKFFCDNLIRIEKNAQRVKATEKNKNLLLGDNARVIAVPKLEVEADDVSAQHGAAISRINAEDLFYLQSRGINPNDAKQLLVNAFLNY